jgi:hypothetical protein
MRKYSNPYMVPPIIVTGQTAHAIHPTPKVISRLPTLKRLSISVAKYENTAKQIKDMIK